MKLFHATPAILAILVASEAHAQGFRRNPDDPIYSLPALVASYDSARGTVQLRLESGTVVSAELAAGCRILREGESGGRPPQPGERLFVQATEPDFSEIIAIWDPLSYCAYGKRSYVSGEVELPERNVLEVTADSRFFRRRRRVHRFDLTPQTQLWIGGQRITSPTILPTLGELGVVVEADGTVFAVFDAESWRIFGAQELRKAAAEVAFLD